MFIQSVGVARSFSTQEWCDWVRAEGGAPGGPPSKENSLTSTPNTGDGVMRIEMPVRAWQRSNGQTVDNCILIVVLSHLAR